jgi:hypothetical protein
MLILLLLWLVSRVMGWILAEGLVRWRSSKGWALKRLMLLRAII